MATPLSGAARVATPLSGAARVATPLSGAARVAAVLGWPVKHSLSPRLHGFWLARHGIDGAYVPLPVRPEDLGATLDLLPRLGLAGVNLTVPHKEAALPLCHRLSPAASRIGAVNTLVFSADGTISGDNSDGQGFLAGLAEAAPAFTPSAGPAVLLGAGGAARSIAVALLDAGAPRLWLVNRTRAKAELLAEHLDDDRVRVADWADRAGTLKGANLLVNTTVLGMTGQPPLDLDLSALPTAAVVADIVYSPLETPLLAAARERGNPTSDGLGMLLHQAAVGFAAWFGVAPTVDAALRAHVLEGLA
ncbi:shikimate dehydrogenase [Roseospirillum parvum]|uniref:Shikimate dehydrogenase (NADP(+)) n=1 Tax=Roseospirillum parvum TaxID=83401 RepID=A0A1G7ZAS0_9PROT|nr:shikimate dehydrogenase [Roseospirillum parvum]SDH05200.1 shikimate dehydrogenase [Roseospirillum parvum]